MASEAVDDQLTERQRRFVEEYIVDPNATQAAIRAGYSKRTAQRMGSENLSKPLIKAAIARHREERCQRLKIDADWVLQQLKDLYEKARAEGNLYVAKSALDSIGKHVDVRAFEERASSGGSFAELLTYMIERYEARLRITRDGEPLAILPPRDTPPQEIPEHPGQA